MPLKPKYDLPTYAIRLPLELRRESFVAFFQILVRATEHADLLERIALARGRPADAYSSVLELTPSIQGFDNLAMAFFALADDRNLFDPIGPVQSFRAEDFVHLALEEPALRLAAEPLLRLVLAQPEVVTLAGELFPGALGEQLEAIVFAAVGLPQFPLAEALRSERVQDATALVAEVEVP